MATTNGFDKYVVRISGGNEGRIGCYIRHQFAFRPIFRTACGVCSNKKNRRIGPGWLIENNFGNK
jgi:hypothetical protein